MSALTRIVKKSALTFGALLIVASTTATTFAASLPNGTANNPLASSSELCSLNIGFAIDRSNSIRNNSESNPARIRTAVNDVVTSLQGTDSKVAVWSFGTKATGYTGTNPLPGRPAITAKDYPGIGFTAVKDATGVQAINSTLNAIPFASEASSEAERGMGWTNWQAGLSEANANGSTPSQANIVFMITDGAPTLPRNFDTEPVEGQSDVAASSVIAGVNAANSVKSSSAKTRIVTLAVGDAIGDQSFIDNIKRITGGLNSSVAGQDYYTGNFSELGTMLKSAIKQACDKTVPPTTTPPVLPKTGAGSAVAIVATIAAGAAGTHYLVSRRRNS